MAATRLADHLIAARHNLNVGRESEKTTFLAALNADELPFHLLYIYGPGGVGKTTLLNEFVRLSLQEKSPAYYIDARDIEPSTEAFLKSLQQALGNPEGALQISSCLQFLASQPGHPVVLIDTYETLSTLDEWLSRQFFPQIPENVMIVLAGRNPPTPVWRADPGWNTLIRVLPLRNLTPEESRNYLLKRQVPVEEHQAVLDFTHGHPLALSLVADVYLQRQSFHFKPEESPDVVKTLLEQFVQKVPGPAHRAALEACALVRMTTESLLAEMLGMKETPYGAGVHDLFDWLRSLSFIESGRGGLFPHDLAREALVADLRWRNPDWYAELHRRARNYFVNRLGQASSEGQQVILMDYVYLHRDNPVVRPFFEWQTGGGALAGIMQEKDIPVLIDMVAQHEGETSARLAAYWFEKQPQNVIVLRDSVDMPIGFLAMVVFQGNEVAQDCPDPAIKSAQEYLQRQAPLRPGETATHFRFWMARDTYQGISPAQSLIVMNIVRHYLTTPGLAFTLFPVADPEFWAPLGAYANLVRIPSLDYEIEGKHYGVFGHDWRLEPPVAWLSLLADREIATSPALPQAPQVTERLVVLSRDEFANAVLEALRNLSRPDGLAGNPLARSRLVVEKTGTNAAEPERQEQLRSLIKGALESLNASPRDAKLHRALYHTYVQPAPTQEAAAELLDLPFSTYRRHLKEGISRIVEILWQREISG